MVPVSSKATSGGEKMSSPSREGCGIVGEAPTPRAPLGVPAIPTVEVPVQPGWLDEVEARMVKIGGQVQAKGEVLKEFPVVHRFTPGLYVREIFMPAGSVIVSKIHKTEHPYVVSKGLLYVYIEGSGWEKIQAPHTGITKPGTRRLLVIQEDTIWSTFHPTELTDLIEIEESILVAYQNPLLTSGVEEQV